MSALPKKKLCWQCEGSIDRHMDNCPYCGVYVHAQEDESNSSWNPSFSLKLLSKEKKESAAEKKEPEPMGETAAVKETPVEVNPFEHIKTEIMPLALLLAGSCFFLFAIVLLLFSHEGTLTLRWNGDNWIYYMLVALPSLFFGWRTLT